MQAYLTPVELSRYNGNIPDVCLKHKERRGTLVHCMWHCTKIALFWEEISDIIQNIISKQIILDPK